MEWAPRLVVAAGLPQRDMAGYHVDYVELVSYVIDYGHACSVSQLTSRAIR
jgi:hypothetical protein